VNIRRGFHARQYGVGLSDNCFHKEWIYNFDQD